MITDETLVALAERLEELEARSELLYSTLLHIRAVARKAVIPGADMAEQHRKIADLALGAKNQCDGLLVAGHLRGMEIADEEIVALAKAAGGFNFLTPEGKIKYIGARKRADRVLRTAIDARRESASSTPPTGIAPSGPSITLTK